MSLINDALKKAQRQRTGDTPASAPLPGGGSRPPVEGRPAAFRLQVMLLAGGALLGLLIATGAMFLSRRDAPAPTKAGGAPSTVAKADATPTPAPSGETKATPAPIAAAPTVALPREEPKIAPAKTPPPAEPSVATASDIGTLPPKTTGATSTPAVAKAAPSEPPLPSARMVKVCEALRVAGIRATGGDSKVLMNDRVFRLGDVVDYELGIKLTAATPNSLTFADATGATYTRNF